MTQGAVWDRAVGGRTGGGWAAVAWAALAAVVAALALSILLPPRAAPIDVGAYWTEAAARAGLMGLAGVALIWSALWGLALRRRPGRAAASAVIVALAWLVGSVPAPFLRSQSAVTVGPAVEEIDNRYGRAMAQDKVAFVERFNQLGLGYAILPGALAVDHDLTAARAKLAQARGLLADYRRTWAAEEASERAEVAQVGPSALPAFDAKLAAYRAMAARDTQAEDAQLAAFGHVVDLFATRPWVIRDGFFVFRNPRDIAEMQAGVADLKRLTYAVKNLEYPEAKDPHAPAAVIPIQIF